MDMLDKWEYESMINKLSDNLKENHPRLYKKFDIVETSKGFKIPRIRFIKIREDMYIEGYFSLVDDKYYFELRPIKGVGSAGTKAIEEMKKYMREANQAMLDDCWKYGGHLLCMFEIRNGDLTASGPIQLIPETKKLVDGMDFFEEEILARSAEFIEIGIQDLLNIMRENQ